MCLPELINLTYLIQLRQDRKFSATSFILQLEETLLNDATCAAIEWNLAFFRETEFYTNRSREQFVINIVLKVLLCGI